MTLEESKVLLKNLEQTKSVLTSYRFKKSYAFWSILKCATHGKHFLKLQKACKASGLEQNQSTKCWKIQFVHLSHLVNSRQRRTRPLKSLYRTLVKASFLLLLVATATTLVDVKLCTFLIHNVHTYTIIPQQSCGLKILVRCLSSISNFGRDKGGWGVEQSM